MRTVVVVVVAVLALGAAAFLLLRKDGEGFLGLGGAAEREELTEEERALLESSPSLEGSNEPRRPRRPEPLAPSAPEPARNEEWLLRVRVVDDATGGPLAGAVVELRGGSEPCPSLSTRLVDPDSTRLGPRVAPDKDSGPPGPDDGMDFRTNAEGWVDLSLMFPKGTRFGVHARVAGYVVGATCEVSVPSETTVRLVRALPLRGRVVDRLGKPIAGAVLWAEPGEGTSRTLGHIGGARADETGAFSIDGLLAGQHRITVSREGFWPLTVEAEDPTDPRERTYVLQPAFVLKFRLRSDDGREIVTPTLQATGASRTPFTLVQILKLTDDTTADGRLTAGVPVPATLGTVSLEVKAEGYAAWRMFDVPVPPEGGEQTFLVKLGRDTGQGGVRLVFEDERGQILKYGALNALPPTIQPLERQDLAGGIVYEVQESLRFPSLPAGKYRIGVTAFAYAPASVDALVLGGSEAEVRVPLRAAARLRVRFTAPTARTVKFRLTQGGRPVPALTEKAPVRDPAKPEEDAVLTSGEEGVILGGLASGSYVVEVVSEDLQASRTSVSVREGETEEVEIRVHPR
jgi:hypothetical protein